MEELIPHLRTLGLGAGGGAMAILVFLWARASNEAKMLERTNNIKATMKALGSRIAGVSLNHQARLLSLERRLATLEGRVGASGPFGASTDTPVPMSAAVTDQEREFDPDVAESEE